MGDKFFVKWQPPALGWYEVNVDVVVDVQVGALDFIVGMIIRNDKVEFVEGMLRSFNEE